MTGAFTTRTRSAPAEWWAAPITSWGKGWDSEIDAHDTVIRFSCAPTAGFETDVGKKTSFRFVYPEAMGGATDMTPHVCGGVLSKEELSGTTALVVLYKEPDINWWLKYKRFPNKYLIIPPAPCCFWRNV